MSSTDAPPPRPDGPPAGAATRERGKAAAARVAAAPRTPWLVLALMTTSSVAGLRSAPTTAVHRAPALVPMFATGLLSSAAAMAVGFVPSSQFGSGSVWSSIGIVSGGLLVLGLLIPALFLRLRKPGWHGPEAAAEPAGREPAEPRDAQGGQIVRTLGADGGDDPSNALTRAQWKYGISSGAGGPGRRPVLSDRGSVGSVRAAAVVLSVYCPDELSAIQDRFDGLDLRETARR